MPQANWFVFDNYQAAQELAYRIGAYIYLHDAGSTGSAVWNPIYQDEMEDPSVFIVQSDPTLFKPDGVTPKDWLIEATYLNNPAHFMIDIGTPLFSVADLSMRQLIEVGPYIPNEYYLPEPPPPPEE